jgi:hypothetical protein
MSTTELHVAICARPFPGKPAGHATIWFAKRPPGGLVDQEGRRPFSRSGSWGSQKSYQRPARSIEQAALYSKFACVVLAKLARRPHESEPDQQDASIQSWI